MKLSQFNIEAEQDGKYIVFNTLSSSMVRLDSDTYRDVFAGKDFSDLSTIDSLKRMGFLVDDEIDEYEIITESRRKFLHFHGKDKIRNVTILLTTACNARCYYCFEKGVEAQTLAFEDCDAIVRFICGNSDDGKIRIHWFGGEPLLAFDRIVYIYDELIKRGMDVSSQITTNGLLVDDEIVEFFVRAKIRVVQITIDGIGEEYNRIKSYVHADGNPFGTVVSNIRKLLEYGVRTRIRINYRADDIAHGETVYRNLKGILGSNDNLSIYLASLTLHGCGDSSVNKEGHRRSYFEMLDFSDREGSNIRSWNDKREMSSEDRLLYDYFMLPIPLACGMEGYGGVVIGADGLLYKCHRLAGRKEYSCGDVWEGLDDGCENIGYFLNPEMPDEKCRACAFLPLCHGGCKANRLIYPENSHCLKIKGFAQDLLRHCFKKILILRGGCDHHGSD